MNKKEYKTGDSIGILILIEEAESLLPQNGILVRRGVFECPRCNKRFIASINSVQQLQTKSCGCLKKIVLGESTKTHGMSQTDEYNIWNHIRNRCKDLSKKNYGGKGIRVCERWEKFELFFEDMGARPTSKHTLDRFPDNHGNYEPNNCRWATKKEQNNNKTNNIRISYNDEIRTLKEWADFLGIKYSALFRRYKSGWGVVEMFTTPIRLRLYNNEII